MSIGAREKWENLVMMKSLTLDNLTLEKKVVHFPVETLEQYQFVQEVSLIGICLADT